jgi:hypothetical protein
MRGRSVALAAVATALAVVLTSTAASASSVTTPNVVTLLPSATMLEVPLIIDCSPPGPGLSGPLTPVGFPPVSIEVVITQDGGAVSGQGHVSTVCGRQAMDVVTDPDSPPFHLGDAQITVN